MKDDITYDEWKKRKGIGEETEYEKTLTTPSHTLAISDLGKPWTIKKMEPYQICWDRLREWIKEYDREHGYRI